VSLISTLSARGVVDASYRTLRTSRLFVQTGARATGWTSPLLEAGAHALVLLANYVRCPPLAVVLDGAFVTFGVTCSVARSARGATLSGIKPGRANLALGTLPLLAAGAHAGLTVTGHALRVHCASAVLRHGATTALGVSCAANGAARAVGSLIVLRWARGAAGRRVPLTAALAHAVVICCGH
jgi:hypothetical protein